MTSLGKNSIYEETSKIVKSNETKLEKSDILELQDEINEKMLDIYDRMGLKDDYKKMRMNKDLRENSMINIYKDIDGYFKRCLESILTKINILYSVQEKGMKLQKNLKNINKQIREEQAKRNKKQREINILAEKINKNKYKIFSLERWPYYLFIIIIMFLIYGVLSCMKKDEYEIA